MCKTASPPKTSRTYPPCPGCGAKTYDRGRAWRILRLCVYCAQDRDIRRKRFAELRAIDPPRDGRPVKALPGSKAKLTRMIARADRKRSLFHPGDLTDVEGLPLDKIRRLFAGLTPTDDPPPVEAERITGIEQELDRNRKQHAYRARQCWRCRKVNLGCYLTRREAEDSVRRFRKEIGYARRKGKFSACAAVVRIVARIRSRVEMYSRRRSRWLEIEFPPDVDRKAALRAGYETMKREYTSTQAATAAFWRHLRAIEKTGKPAETPAKPGMSPNTFGSKYIRRKIRMPRHATA